VLLGFIMLWTHGRKSNEKHNPLMRGIEIAELKSAHFNSAD